MLTQECNLSRQNGGAFTGDRAGMCVDRRITVRIARAVTMLGQRLGKVKFKAKNEACIPFPDLSYSDGESWLLPDSGRAPDPEHRESR